MLRLGLRLLGLSLVLMAIGWMSYAHGIFEVIRLACVACLTLALVLLILNYLRTPDPSGG